MNIDGKGLDDILEHVVKLTDRVGALLLDGLDRPKRVTHKGEVDLVTEYDRRAEELIAEELTRHYPEFGLIAEESATGEEPQTAYKWIVDPLDGTTNYSHGHPMFAVSIGLEYRGEIVCGVIHMPALGQTTWARRGAGAFSNGNPISVSTTPHLDYALLATGFPYDRRAVVDDNSAEFVAFMKRSQGIRRCGAAAVDMALVARGVYDGFWEPRLHAWDLAAGVVIIEEAGGRVTSYANTPCDIRAGWVVASNELIHNQMIEVLGPIRAKIERNSEL